ncbi:hypothetical protein LOZ66_001278 [Ophidiomyces ophidiicola]|nr:hypothetical protein LOZ66_001278 [Ophidiomyces ophidiicola]
METISRGSLPLDTPAFATPLQPFIKTPDEALRIRRLLALRLQDQLAFADDGIPQSHFSVCAPYHVRGVKRIPPEFGDGLRAQYLTALQANLRARKEYDEQLAEVNGLAEQLNGRRSSPSPDSTNRNLDAYLALLRSRRQRSKIQICQHFLEKLNKMDAARPGYLDMRSAAKGIYISSQGHATHQDDPSVPGVGNSPTVLLHELERAVLLSKSRIDNEKTALERLRGQSKLRKSTEGDIDPQVRLNALIRTRDELVRWVENTLATCGMEDTSIIQEEQPCDARDEDAVRALLEGLRRDIAQRYTAYIFARRSLLDAVSAATSMPMKPPAKALPTKPQYQEPEQAPTDLTPVFPYLQENLSPLSKAQNAMTIQKSFLSALLSKERWTSGKVFERLRNESHLLPDYPILTGQPRFKHIAAAANTPRSGIEGPVSSPSSEVEVVRHAEAWAFASKAAHDATAEQVDRHIEVGTEMTASTENTLRRIYDIMNRDYDAAMSREGDKGGHTTDSRNAQSLKGAQRPQGPWAKLQGNIGVGGG